MNSEDEHVPRVRTGRVPDTGASVSLELGCTTPSTPMWPPSWKFSEPRTRRNCMEASAHRPDGSLPPSPSPLPFLEDGVWGQKFLVSNTFW